jgi:hypothetical protein
MSRLDQALEGALHSPFGQAAFGQQVKSLVPVLPVFHGDPSHAVIVRSVCQRQQDHLV